MNWRRQFSWIFSAAGLLALILDGKTALSGAADGIELCIKTIIPALFPFLVLSALFLRQTVPFPRMETVLSSLLGFPQGSGSLVLPCILGGYPVGAKSVYQAYANGLLSKRTAERMLAFCNNAGPAFVFGVLGQMFPKPWMPWALWGIHLAGARFAAFCVPTAGTPAVPEKPSAESSLMSGAVRTMGTVCGWIILFRVLIAFLDRWFLWLLPQSVRVMLVGLLELSNGCCDLLTIADVSTRFILCSVLLGAGGLCIAAQTVSVTPGMSLRYYYFGKLIQILVSVALSYGIIRQTVWPMIALLLPLLYQIGKKRSSNRVLSGV